MNTIDFSCKHDILIRNPDGSLQPMDEPFYESIQIAPGTWRILSDGDYQYLVEGENEAILIDSGYGAGNIREYAQTLTEKPLRCIINTHDHFDHTANNSYFEKAYMTAATKELATIPFPSFAGIDFPRDYPVEVVSEGYVFDLGGRTLEVFEMNFHAVGSLLLLDRKERILFSGDEIFAMGCSLRAGRTVEEFGRKLGKIAAHRSEFDHLCAGAWSMIDAVIIDQLMDSVNFVLGGGEGTIPEPRKGPGPMQAEAPDPQGRTIYKRMAPRPEDMKHGKPQGQEYQRVVTQFGTRLTYDMRYVHDEK